MIIEFETENSTYEVDYTLNVYRRLPLYHTAYQAPEIRNRWGSSRLVDGVWLDLCPERQAYVDRSGEYPVLRIFAPDSVGGVVTSEVLSFKVVEF